MILSSRLNIKNNQKSKNKINIFEDDLKVIFNSRTFALWYRKIKKIKLG